MASRSSSRGGGASTALSTGDAGGELRAGLTNVVLGNGPKVPVYGRRYSQQNSLKFYTKYAEYERSLELANSGQTFQRPLLQVAQLLPKSIRSCLSRVYFDGTELEENDLREALAKHAECWTGDTLDPSIAAADVSRLVAMGSEQTAVDRFDALLGRLENYFENPTAETIFRESNGKYKKGPAAVITKALVANLHPPEFKTKVESKLDMQGGWKEKPELVFDVVRDAAVEWRTVLVGEDCSVAHRVGGRSQLSQEHTSGKVEFPDVPCAAAERVVRIEMVDHCLHDFHRCGFDARRKSLNVAMHVSIAAIHDD